MQNFVNFYLGKNQSSIYLPAGEGKVSFVDVRDIAAVAVRALASWHILLLDQFPGMGIYQTYLEQLKR